MVWMENGKTKELQLFVLSKALIPHEPKNTCSSGKSYLLLQVPFTCIEIYRRVIRKTEKGLIYYKLIIKIALASKFFKKKSKKSPKKKTCDTVGYTNKQDDPNYGSIRYIFEGG